MKSPYDTEAINAQIERLKLERDRIDQAIRGLELAQSSMTGASGIQRELPLIKPSNAEVSLFDAVRTACMEMVDGITRQRVILAIERAHPFLKPNPSSVAAAMVNLSKGPDPLLHLTESGSGRRPAVYSTEGEMVLKLSSDEIEGLTDINALKGTGGWQSLWSAMLKNFDKSTGSIRLAPQLRARIQNYYRSYGVGGWQNKVRRVFRRHLPHLFE